LNTSSSTSGITFDVIEDTGTSTRASSSALNSNSPVIARSDFSWSEGVWGVTNTKDRDGCLLYAEYEYEGNLKNKSSIMIAKRRHDTTARFSIDNEKFRSLRQGDTHAITLSFIREKPRTQAGVRGHSGRWNTRMGAKVCMWSWNTTPS
jgi:hypothetical protein